jgi:hypothetical protein
LIGDIVGSEGGEEEASVRFTSFKLPSKSRPKFLIGNTCGLDLNRESDGYGYLIATPFVAIAVMDASDEDTVGTFAPPQAYYNLRDMLQKFPDAIKLIKTVPQAWCYERINLEYTADAEPETVD